MTQQSGGKGIIIKSYDEIMIMQEANQIVAETLIFLKKFIEPGISTLELDRIAEDFCKRRQADPAFKGYRGFPGSLCTSINEEVVHGIPSRKRKLKKGDILSIDFGVRYKGYFGDSAITVAVDKISIEVQSLLKVTEEALERSIHKVKVGNRISDISIAVQQFVEEAGFSVVRQFVGHGIGTSLHESPEIPNFFSGEHTPRLIPGMVLAIEPMVNMGTSKVKVLRDGWTVVTTDGKPSAHFEHSVAVTEDGPIVLSYRYN
jgi:methionyl aminopeptidase